MGENTQEAKETAYILKECDRELLDAKDNEQVEERMMSHGNS